MLENLFQLQRMGIGFGKMQDAQVEHFHLLALYANQSVTHNSGSGINAKYDFVRHLPYVCPPDAGTTN
jgi:hypothetical protein